MGVRIEKRGQFTFFRRKNETIPVFFPPVLQNPEEAFEITIVPNDD